MASASTQEETPVTPAGRFSHAWRALRHRNYRLFFGGQLVSLVGTWMQMVAEGWLVYQLSNSSSAIAGGAFVVLGKNAPNAT